jgi:hypothetical protein
LLIWLKCYMNMTKKDKKINFRENPSSYLQFMLECSQPY